MSSFIRCTLPCSYCAMTLATETTLKTTIPRKHLHRVARDNGAVEDQAGRWFCNGVCRVSYRMAHPSKHEDVPDV